MPRADRRNARGSGQIPTSPLHADLLPRCPALSPMGRQHLSLPPETARVPVRALPFPTRVPTPPTPTGGSSLPFAGVGHRGERLGTSRVVRAAMADPSVLRLLVARPVTSRRVHVPVAFARSSPAAGRVAGNRAQAGARETETGVFGDRAPNDLRQSRNRGSVCPSEVTFQVASAARPPLGFPGVRWLCVPTSRLVCPFVPSERRGTILRYRNGANGSGPFADRTPQVFANKWIAGYGKAP